MKTQFTITHHTDDYVVLANNDTILRIIKYVSGSLSPRIVEWDNISTTVQDLILEKLNENQSE